MKKLAAIALLVVLFPSLACALPVAGGARPTPQSGDAVVNTAAAQTVEALRTALASGQNPTLAGGTAAPTLPAGPQATVTAIGPGALKTATGAPGSGSQASATPASSAPCNRASFVRDVTVPDDSVILPNSPFVKTWELKNTGSCAWTPAYQVVFAGQGDALGGASSPLISGGEVKPGETAFVSANLRAPEGEGEYKGYWMLRAPDGKMFGTGETGAAPFYVQMRVGNEYRFAEHLCSAAWSSSGDDSLPCPGSGSDAQGYVLQVEDPTLEDGQQREGVSMLTVPAPSAGGTITAKFGPVLVPPESDFRAVVGCQQDANGCFVRFKVTYRVDNGEEQLLGEWNEGYEGGITNAVKDLDMVANRLVSFTFTVTVAGTPSQSKAIWFEPRIIKQ